MKPSIVLGIFALFVTSAAGASETLIDEGFTGGTGGWVLRWGDQLFHDAGEGDLTPGGSARVEGHLDTFAGFQLCVDVTDQPIFDSKYEIAVSVKPSALAPPTPVSGVIVDYAASPGCTDFFDSKQILAYTAPGTWSRVEGDFTPPPEAQSFQLVVFSYGTPDGGITFFDDVELVQTGPREMLENPRFSNGNEGWLSWWGDDFSHDPMDGDVTAGGAAQMVGHVDTFAGIGQLCFDLASDPDPGNELFVSAAMKPDSGAAGPPISGIAVYYYSDPDCATYLANHQILAYSTPGAWSRVGNTFTPPPDVRSVGIILFVYGTPDGGTTLFDDATFFKTSSVFKDGFETGDLSAWSP